ncbi:MAG: tyrosine-type recombinase/integrase [Bacteroidetes bacterium]|nr:tyrosine-type recombinase/integrase [Bacteroidota bacterium]
MHLTEFIDYLKYEKRYSAHTITSYKNDLSQFFVYLSKQYENLKFDEVSHLHIRSWMVSLIEAKTSTRTVNRKISTLKSYCKYLLKMQLIANNPTRKIVSPKNPKRLPTFVEESKMDMLFSEVPFGDDYVGYRNRLIIELFYTTGIRLSELLNIKENDIDISNQTIKVLGKRNKERIVPISEKLVESITSYMQIFRKTFPENTNAQIFCTEKGTPLYAKAVYDLVKKYLSLVTTVDKKSPHVLRHTFATHMLNNGADINAIKEILGHASLAATQIYTHNSIEKLKEIHKKAHPKS